MKKIGIVGATGYTGVELLRILSTHPHIELSMVTSRSHQGTRVDALFPSLRGHVDLEFTTPNIDEMAQCDLVFFATPNGIAMQEAKELLERNVKVIDLAADYRINDVNTWEKWYGMTHATPELLSEAVYGLPEMYRENIKQARLVANPGCYPTAVTLGLLPLIQHNLADLDLLIADTKSGISGAGRQANVANLLSEAGDSFKAYGVAGHRHQPEIEQTLSKVAGKSVNLTFVPHLLPIIRGIHATLYTRVANEHDLQAIYEDFYADQPCVDVMPQGSHPETRSVRGSNTCRIAIHRPGNGERVVVLSVIDNLVKGAAGQAVQNMNVMLDFDEMTALSTPPLLP